MVGGGNEVLDIGEKGGVGEVTIGITESGEVESEGGESSFGEGS